MTMADTLTVVTPNSLGISGTVTGSDTTDSNGDWKDTYFWNGKCHSVVDV